jgi:hypothetical protein
VLQEPHRGQFGDISTFGFHSLSMANRLRPPHRLHEDSKARFCFTVSGQKSYMGGVLGKSMHFHAHDFALEMCMRAHAHA